MKMEEMKEIWIMIRNEEIRGRNRVEDGKKREIRGKGSNMQMRDNLSFRFKGRFIFLFN